ncbi:MAG: hypothetical protein QY325_06935 [Flavobacteriales bacterium]|nr:MAG: hypothetical protein QY325_06935 [Flavobacteriales bacterium]
MSLSRTIALFLLLPMLVAWAPSIAVAQNQDAHLVLKLQAFDADAHARLQAEVAKDRSMSLEYACEWSGVVVLKLTDVPLSDRADAITYVRRLLQSARVDKGAEFLNVHLEARGTGKC